MEIFERYICERKREKTRRLRKPRRSWDVWGGDGWEREVDKEAEQKGGRRKARSLVTLIPLP